MTLKAIHFLHIGDIHYPDAKEEVLADDKDPAFPDLVKRAIRMQPLTCVARKVAYLLERPHSKANGLFFTGDLTTRGDVSGYRDCLDYLNRLLNFRRWKQEEVHVVPGNHDVDRSAIDATGSNYLAKFAKFDEAWRAYGLPVLTLEMRESMIRLVRRSSGGAKVFSLNSSVGCGEKRHLPECIATELYELLDKYRATVDEKKAFELIGETLDTPAFDQNQLDKICQEVESLRQNCIPILVTHHNLLPQALPRVAMYTELLNAGTMRSRLSKLQRPILYCHGHIHDYPLEVLVSPEYPGSKVISISAPTLSRGFNWITIEYGANSMPLGCVVESFRLSERDCEVRPFTFRIPFHSPGDNVPRFPVTRDLRRVFATLPDGEIRAVDLAEKCGMEIEALVNHLLEGEWLGALELSDRDQEPTYWTVRRATR
jgi:3',5'-cyclic AMP phosphodiesterase CpdA